MKQIILFAFAGIVGYLVDIGILLLVTVSIGPYFGRLISFLAAVITTWLINRSLAFRYMSSNLSLQCEFLLYALTALGGGVANLVSYAILVKFFSQEEYILPSAVAVGSLLGMLINFWLSRKFVFKTMKEFPGA